MKNFSKTSLLASTILVLGSTQIHAQERHVSNHDNHTGHVHPTGPAAPISIMGDHVHDKGEWMLSYRIGHMHMEGNRKGTNSISPSEIVSTVSNPNAPPANVRVVPTKMHMKMHMLGVMYGLTDNLTLMAMASYMYKNMDHVTFQGMAGTTELGTFNTKSSGIGDTKISGIYNLFQSHNHRINLQMGISLPTGSIKEKDNVLTPMNTRPSLRLPYAMQLGSGTYDALPGITYVGNNGKWGWGTQYNAVIRMESENSQNYRLGHQHRLTAWGAYDLGNGFTLNALANAETLGEIKGRDENIAAPVQTANPDNYGGDIIELGAGFTYEPKDLENLSVGLDFRAPVYQDLNGVQMERDYTISAGITFRF